MPGEKQTKVLAFRQGADFYFSRYERLLAREDYVDALSALRTAHEKAPDNLEYTMELAELYTEMDFYEESNCLLLGIFSKEPGVSGGMPLRHGVQLLWIAGPGQGAGMLC